MFGGDRALAGDCVKAGDDLLSPWTDYHRPRVLNGRVRDGNGCGHSGLVTGSTVARAPVGPRRVYGGFLGQFGGHELRLLLSSDRSGGADRAAKRSAVSTG